MFYVMRPTKVIIKDAVVVCFNVFFYHNIHMNVLNKTPKITLVTITESVDTR